LLLLLSDLDALHDLILEPIVCCLARRIQIALFRDPSRDQTLLKLCERWVAGHQTRLRLRFRLVLEVNFWHRDDLSGRNRHAIVRTIAVEVIEVDHDVTKVRLLIVDNSEAIPRGLVALEDLEVAVALGIEARLRLLVVWICFYFDLL